MDTTNNYVGTGQKGEKSWMVLSLLIILIVISGFVFLKEGNGDEPKGGSKPSDAVLKVVEKYVQAQENSVGADQTSPTAWLNQVKPITTTGWFKKLQPQGESTTGNTSYDYEVAHEKNYVVKSVLSKCVWDDILVQLGKFKGLVICNLTDETIDRNSGSIIPAGSLPFGWGYSGRQASPQLILVKQDGRWLINGDATGQGL